MFVSKHEEEYQNNQRKHYSIIKTNNATQYSKKKQIMFRQRLYLLKIKLHFMSYSVKDGLVQLRFNCLFRAN